MMAIKTHSLLVLVQYVVMQTRDYAYAQIPALPHLLLKHVVVVVVEVGSPLLDIKFVLSCSVPFDI